MRVDDLDLVELICRAATVHVEGRAWVGGQVLRVVPVRGLNQRAARDEDEVGATRVHGGAAVEVDVSDLPADFWLGAIRLGATVIKFTYTKSKIPQMAQTTTAENTESKT